MDTLLTLHEDHLVTYTDKPYKLVADGTKRLIVPQRAIGCKLKDIQCKIGNSYFELGRIDLGEISDYSMYPFSNIYGGDIVTGKSGMLNIVRVKNKKLRYEQRGVFQWNK